ncbi:ABC transporter substrate-binding protein [Agaricicola taiwanensis]|uniref:ABC transporter substrate-binding protein n=1 Tax=Agaricicola taiwanensis TaxID=591372 RepID=A0A8J2VLP1_9RHOB|nr:ABC transporter substrate-binding protein [Agaricicola taiwanensis]GGE31710.1 ABC transporter substrate-binding protein [Agaricicola taiwanensis]
MRPILALSVLCGALACLASPSAKAETVPLKVVIGSNSFAYGGMRVAEHAGILEKNGIKAEIVVAESGNAATTALISGSAEVAASGPEQVIAAAARGQKIVILGNLYRGLSGSLVLSEPIAKKMTVKRDAPVVERLRALDGLTIATPSATSAYTVPLKTFAEMNDVKINFTYMAQSAMPAALKTGAINGMMAGSPYTDAGVLASGGTLWIDGTGGELPEEVEPTSSTVLQTTEEFAKTNPDVVKRLIKSLEDLKEMIAQDPDGVKAAMSKAYPKLDKSTIDSVFERNSANWAQPEYTMAQIQKELGFVKTQGRIQGADKIVPESLLYSNP